MQRLFGLPIATLATILVALVVAILAGLASVAIRNRVFVKLAFRNVTRRRGRTVLILVGLMLGTTIVATALATGDTVTRTIRSSVITSLGRTDETVSAKGAKPKNVVAFGEATGVGYFDEELAATVRARVQGSDLVDGVAGAIIEPVSVQDHTSRQTEPAVTVFGAEVQHLDSFGPIRTPSGRTVSLRDLGQDQVFATSAAIDKFGARAGDRLTVFTGSRAVEMRVRSVVSFDGAGTDGAAILMPLPRAQALFDEPGRIGQVLISNAGDELSGVDHTAEVRALVQPLLAGKPLQVDPVKRDALDNADEQGRSFLSLFTTFGTFSIVAGILLIFLIFVMLASERRTEMGIARAIGTRRGHLVQTFVYEGMAYDLIAALVGAALGVAIAYGMIAMLAASFKAVSDLRLSFSVQPSSVVVAYALGVIISFVVISLSAWRVSRLNIVAAVRNLPDETDGRGGQARRWSGIATVGFGLVLTMSGIGGRQATPMLLGLSIVFIGSAMVARAFGAAPRIAYTLGGTALVAMWLLPFRVYGSIVPGLAMDFSTWVVSGLILVLGAVWLLIYNDRVLLTGVTKVAGRIRSLAPILKTSLAYPMRERFRTGTILAVFTLVVFTLVVGATTSSAFSSASDNVTEFGGGYDVRATTSPLNPISDLRAAIASSPRLHASDFHVVAAQSYLPVDARQAGSDHFDAYQARGLDDTYLQSTKFGLAAIAHGYTGAPDVWRALQAQPGLAVVDALVVPHRNNWNFGALPDFRLSGFAIEDKTFDPVIVTIRDPQTGITTNVKVIGVLKDTAAYATAGILTSQRTLAPFGDRVRPSVYYFRLAPGTDPVKTARSLESAFLDHGMQADSMPKVLNDLMEQSRVFQRIILGFLGLGLVVGVAGLGVISARAVVERRQHIGVMRAIGFRSRAVQASFVLEASFLALLSITFGTGLGLAVAYNVIDDASRQATWTGIHFAVPWTMLVSILAIVYVVAVATALIPARKASRVHPATALRYQ